MAKSSGPVVGLDIGTAFIKAVEMVSRGGRPEVTAVGIMPTPADAVIQGLVIDPPAMGVTLRHLLDISGIKARKVISSLAGVNNVTVRIIEVPKMSDRELGESMKSEIERFVPFAHGQDLERDYRTLPVPATTDGNMQVILAVAVQDVVASHVQALKAAGLDPVAIEVEPLAIARSLTGLNDGGQPLNETVGVINMGYSNTELSVITGGMLVFPRTISIGGESFTRSIAENLGMRIDAAERLKRQYAQIDLEQIAQSQGAGDSGGGGGGVTDFGLGDLGGFGGGLGAPPSFDYNAPPPAPASGAMPGLNPMLYGGAEPPAPRPADIPGFASPPEEEVKAPTGAVFDLEDDDGDNLASLFAPPPKKADSMTPAVPTAPAAPPPVAPPPSSAAVPGFDLGFGDVSDATPSAPMADSPDAGFAAGPGAAPGAGPGAVSDAGGLPEFGSSFPPADAPPPSPFGAEGAPVPAENLTPATGFGAPSPSPAAGDVNAGGPGHGGFDLSGFDLGGGLPPVGHVTDASPAMEDEETQTIRQVQDIILPVLGELVTELRRSLEYYRSHNPTLPVTRLFLSGGSARMPNLDKFLENELGIPVTLANPLAAVSPNVPTAPPGWLSEIAPVLSIAVGLGERDMVDLPRDYVPRTLAAAAPATP